MTCIKCGESTGDGQIFCDQCLAKMTCLKCGRELNQNQTFCDQCLAQMAAHPVKPDTPIRLPKRKAPTVSRTPRKRRRTPEEELAKARKRLLRLRLVSLTLCLVLIATAIVGLSHLQRQQQRRDGRNYTVVRIDLDPTEDTVSRETSESP